MSNGPSLSLSVAPAVVFSIGEIYQRRSDLSPTRIVGALLGSFRAGSSNGELHISHAFVVPHSEVADQVAINSEYYKQRLDLHKKGYGSSSTLVGWFSATQDGAVISEKNTAFINDSFAREVASGGACPVAIHLNLNISKNGAIEKTATATDVSHKGRTLIEPRPLLSSADSFAFNMIHSNFQAHSDVDLIDSPDITEFLASQNTKLNQQIERIGKLLESGSLSSENQASASATIEAAKRLLNNTRQTTETSALGDVCKNISSQLECLESMVLYQP